MHFRTVLTGRKKRPSAEDRSGHLVHVAGPRTETHRGEQRLMLPATQLCPEGNVTAPLHQEAEVKRMLTEQEWGWGHLCTTTTPAASLNTKPAWMETANTSGSLPAPALAATSLLPL